VRAIAEGDRVLYAPDTGYDVEIRGDDYIILREREIHAMASERIEDRTGLYL
jgi:chaperonin GroES